MITLFIGDNSFEIERALQKIATDFDGIVEKIEGSDLVISQLPDILMGVSLFATKRTIIIRNLSENKSIWSVFSNWIPKISDDIHLVLIEPKPDKRTTTFKSLKNSSDVHESQQWSDSDIQKAEKWVASEALRQELELNKKSVQTLVQWVGVDQWQLFHAIEKLKLVDVVSDETIKDVIEASPFENVFSLFEAALTGDAGGLSRTLKTLEQSEDVFRLFALLSTQAFQLAVVASATENDSITKDFGLHPYVVSKLSPAARRLGKSGVSKIIAIFAETDDDIKTSKADPWLLIERALIKVANT